MSLALTRLNKALSYKREAWLQLEILEGLGHDPSHERDVAYDAYDAAYRKWHSIITEEWELRQMERFIPHAAPVEAGKELEAAHG